MDRLSDKELLGCKPVAVVEDKMVVINDCNGGEQASNPSLYTLLVRRSTRPRIDSVILTKPRQATPKMPLVLCTAVKQRASLGSNRAQRATKHRSVEPIG